MADAAAKEVVIIGRIETPFALPWSWTHQKEEANPPQCEKSREAPYSESSWWNAQSS